MKWKVTEIAMADIPRRRSKWAEFCREIALRLERTGSSRALAIEFDTEREAACAQAALRRRLHGQGCVRVVGRVLYVTSRPPRGRVRNDKSS